MNHQTLQRITGYKAKNSTQATPNCHFTILLLKLSAVSAELTLTPHSAHPPLLTRLLALFTASSSNHSGAFIAHASVDFTVAFVAETSTDISSAFVSNF